MDKKNGHLHRLIFVAPWLGTPFFAHLILEGLTLFGSHRRYFFRKPVFPVLLGGSIITTAAAAATNSEEKNFG